MSVIQYDYQKKIDDILSTGKKRSYFVAAVTVFFILIMSLAGIIPALSSLGVQHEENGKRDVIIDKLQTKLNTLKSFVKEADEKKSVINFLNYVLPDKFPEKESLNKIVALAEKDSVDPESFNFQPADSDVQDSISEFATPNIKALVVTMTTKGALGDLQTFVKDLEFSRRVIDVVDASFSKNTDPESSDPTSDNVFNLSVTVNIYYYTTATK